MNEMSEDQLDNLVDEQLRYLRGEGPRPDLSTLNDDEVSEVRKLFEIVDALADSLPATPEFEEDPVAIRLGLVAAPQTGVLTGVPVGDDDPVWISLGDLAARVGETAVQIERLPEPLTNPDGRRATVICRSLAEVVVVVVFDDEPLPMAEDAGTWFRQRPELSAVAFSSDDATRAAVVTPTEAVSFLVPANGWRAPGRLSWEPLEIALGRYFERSTPRWDQVMALPMADLLGDLADETSLVTSEVLDRVARSRPHLPHKRQARDFVTSRNLNVIFDCLDRVRTRRTTAEELTLELSEMCGVAS